MADFPAHAVALTPLAAIVKRHLLLIVCTVAIVTACAAALLTQIKPIYVASAVIEIRPQAVALGGPHAVPYDAQLDPALVGTAVDILGSPSIARRVLDELGLARVPEFTEPSLSGKFANAAAKWMGLGFLLRPAEPDSLDRLALRNLMNSVTASSTQHSRLITISAQATSPQLSSRIANAYASAYLAFEQSLKTASERHLNSLLDDHLLDLKKKSLAAQWAAENFRQKNGLATVAKSRDTGTGLTVTGQQLAELNSQLIAATSFRVEKEATLEQTRALVRAGHPDRIPQVQSSPLIQKLAEQEAELAGREAAFEARVGGSSAYLAAPRAQLHQVRQRIAAEVRNIVGGLSSEANAARAREAGLRANLERLRAHVDYEGDASVRLNELETVAAAEGSVYKDVLAGAKRTASEAGMQRADAELISSAQPPLDPSYPRRGSTLVLSALASSILGVVFALTLERQQTSFRSAEEFEDAAELPVLGLLPEARRRGIGSRRAWGPVHEAFNAVCSRLWSGERSAAGRVLMVTSSVPEEGKTFVTTGLADNFARNGARVLVIDCDLRRAAIAPTLGLTRPGLNALFELGARSSDSREVAHATISKWDIINHVAPGLDVVPVFPGLSDPLRLLKSDRLKMLLQYGRANYDIVLLDSPPVLTVADAGVISTLSDAVILVSRWHSTPRQVVVSALRLLTEYGANVAGGVLNRVKTGQYAFGQFGSHAYVYRSCGAYYSDAHELPRRPGRR